MVVHTVDADSHQQATRAAHGCATGTWRPIYQPVSLQEAPSTGYPSMAFSEGWQFEVETGVLLFIIHW